jgi:sulfoxide reductase catalytic subunit YedY
VNKIASAAITDKQVYLNRRELISAALSAAGGALAGSSWLHAQAPPPRRRTLVTTRSALSTSEAPNTWDQITTYNNFYEFDPVAGDGPSRLAGAFEPEPWTVTDEGECRRRGTIGLADILKGQTLEERVYPHRSAEAWSMIIPWVGFPLSAFITRCEPTGRAKFVEFVSLYDPRQFPGQRRPILEWPYREGLRMDEAMHPLAILAVGVYGEALPNQNGAPLRLVVPWKYGFKSIKSIVTIRFVETQPVGTWQRAYPQAYGFYANVNPNVDHPNWTQATERRLPSLARSTPTRTFNGYADQVAALYAGMDLRINF